MIEKLEQIDTESIDDLIELKKERDVLIERLDRLDDEKSAVSQVVLDRVRGDYESQQSELAKQAAPLKEHARGEFAKLEELLAAAQDALRSTALDREEIELRHQVGEFGDAEFTQHRDEIAEKHDQQEQDLTQIEEVRESFVAAFDSEEDLAAPPPAEAEPEQPEQPPANVEQDVYETQETERKQVAQTKDEEDEEDQEDQEDQETVAENGDVAAEPDSDGTVIEPYDSPEEEGPSEMQPMPPDAVPTGGTVLLSVPAAPPGEMPELGGTTILQQARLVPVEPIAGGSEFSIEPVTTIGRTKENLIRVDEPAVSRGHAQISLTNDGYLLRDLGSENGTFVNGERIDTRLLEEGDRIQIGTVRFVFYDAGS